MEDHSKRKEIYTQLLDDTFDKSVEYKKKIELEKQKKLKEEKAKLEKLIAVPEAKERIIQPETPLNIIPEDKPKNIEEKTELYKQKYLERKRKNVEKHD